MADLILWGLDDPSLRSPSATLVRNVDETRTRHPSGVTFQLMHGLSAWTASIAPSVRIGDEAELGCDCIGQAGRNGRDAAQGLHGRRHTDLAPRPRRPSSGQRRRRRTPRAGDDPTLLDHPLVGGHGSVPGRAPDTTASASWRVPRRTAPGGAEYQGARAHRGRPNLGTSLT